MTETKKKWIMSQLERIRKEKASNFVSEDAMITNEHLSNLKLAPKQIQKLIPTSPQPLKFENARLNALNVGVEEEAYRQ